jgi:NAD(P)-dependent dehydrogenase (short-subunit alcohol dehydrogenase family)
MRAARSGRLARRGAPVRRHERRCAARRHRGDPREIGGLAVFLASRAADYVTGQMIMIDGGISVSL